MDYNVNVDARLEMSTGDRLYGTDGGVLPQRAGIPGCGGMDGVRRDILGVYPSESPSSAKASPHFIGPAQAGLLGYSKTENDLPSSSMHRGREEACVVDKNAKNAITQQTGASCFLSHS